MEEPRFLGLPQVIQKEASIHLGIGGKHVWDLQAPPWLPGPQSAILMRGYLGLSSPRQETSDLTSQMVRFLAASSFMKSNLPLPGPSRTPAKNVRGQEAPLLH